MFVALPEEGQARVGAKGVGTEERLRAEWRDRQGVSLFDTDPHLSHTSVYYSGALGESTREEVAQVVEGLLQQTRIGEAHGDGRT